MKRILILLISSVIYCSASAQVVGTMEVKEPIEGVCNQKEVYTLFPILGGEQVKAVCPVSKEEILKRLNNEVSYLKENPKYKGKAGVNIIINCKGEVAQCKMSPKTKDAELDKQVLAVFNSLGEWQNGTLGGKAVDSVELFTFRIKKGVFFFAY
jgi:hypothetical protein